MVDALGLVGGDPVAAEAAARDALRAAEAVGDGAGSAVARRVLGLVARDGQRFGEAREHFLAGIEVAERGGFVELAALCRVSLAMALSLVGDLDGALAAVDAAVAVLSGRDQLRARFQRGVVLQAVGDNDGALAEYSAVEPALAADDDVATLAQLHNNCGVIRLAAGDLGGASDHFRRAEGLHTTAGNRKARAEVCSHLALVAARQGDALAALGWYDEVDAELAALGVTDAVALKDRVEVLLAAGLTNQAVTTAERAVALLDPGGDNIYLAEAILARAGAEKAAGRRQRAGELERDAAAMLTRLGFRPRVGSLPTAPGLPADVRMLTRPAPDSRHPTTLNDALRTLREARGVTQNQLAEALGVDQTMCSRWESNPNWNPRIDEIAAIDDALGQPRGSLLKAAGYIADITTTEQAVMADPALGPDGRDAILILLRYYHQRATPPPTRRGRPRSTPTTH
jgi:tetratricopeptide (TPR) repeat protein